MNIINGESFLSFKLPIAILRSLGFFNFLTNKLIELTIGNGKLENLLSRLNTLLMISKHF